MSPDEPEYMTTAEVARRLRLTPATVLAMKQRGELKPSGRTGKGWLWRRADVEAMVRVGLADEERARTAAVVRDQLDAALAHYFPSRKRGA